MEIVLQLFADVYRSEEKFCIFNGFLILACIFSYLRIGWFCKVGYHFNTTNREINTKTEWFHYTFKGNLGYLIVMLLCYALEV